MIDVQSRAHRILRQLNLYQDFDGKVPGEVYQVSLPSSAECPLGVYINEPDSMHDAVLFAKSGIYVYAEGRWTEILYKDIQSSVTPISKNNVAGFDVVCKDGTQFWLPIRGTKNGRTYDAFEVLRFVDRVVADLAKRK